jgi:hypothetical protein
MGTDDEGDHKYEERECSVEGRKKKDCDRFWEKL